MKMVVALRSQYEAKERAAKEAEAIKARKEKEKKENLELLNFAFGKLLGEGSYSRVYYYLYIDSYVYIIIIIHIDIYYFSINIGVVCKVYWKPSATEILGRVRPQNNGY